METALIQTRRRSSGCSESGQIRRSSVGNESRHLRRSSIGTESRQNRRSSIGTESRQSRRSSISNSSDAQAWVDRPLPVDYNGDTPMDEGTLSGGVKKHHHKHNLKHRYELLETLGKGTYGKVKKAVERNSGRVVSWGVGWFLTVGLIHLIRHHAEIVTCTYVSGLMIVAFLQWQDKPNLTINQPTNQPVNQSKFR